MTEKRKNEIITDLQKIVDGFEPSEFEPSLTIFGLVSSYNKSGKNKELIGGNWISQNTDIVLN